MYLTRENWSASYIEIAWVVGDRYRTCGRSSGVTSIQADSATPERHDRNPCKYDVVQMSRRTSLQLNNKHEHQVKKATQITASGPNDTPPISVVIDAEFAQLIQS